MKIKVKGLQSELEQANKQFFNKYYLEVAEMQIILTNR
jgi:hypothetical protein